MSDEAIEFGVLDLAHPGDFRILLWAFGEQFAGVDEGKRVKDAGQGEASDPEATGIRFTQGNDPGCERVVDRVIVGPPKPVPGIPEVGFAPVENGMDQRPVPVGHVLNPVVGGVVLVMIEQRRRHQAFPGLGIGPQPREHRAEDGLQLLAALHPGAGTLAEFRHFGGTHTIPELGGGIARHWRRPENGTKPPPVKFPY